MSYKVSASSFISEDITGSKELDAVLKSSLNIDFYNEEIYLLYNWHVIYNYIKAIKDNTMNIFIQAKMLEYLIENHPELNDEISNMKSRLESDSDNILETFRTKILPFPSSSKK